MTSLGAVINQLPLDLFEGGPLNDQGLDLPAFDERGLLPAIVFSDTEAGKIKRLAPIPPIGSAWSSGSAGPISAKPCSIAWRFTARA